MMISLMAAIDIVSADSKYILLIFNWVISWKFRNTIQFDKKNSRHSSYILFIY